MFQGREGCVCEGRSLHLIHIYNGFLLTEVIVDVSGEPVCAEKRFHSKRHWVVYKKHMFVLYFNFSLGNCTNVA